MQQKKTIGIIGGMGPLATVDLFQKIISLVDSPSDQGYPHILVDNNTAIPDRTDAILYGGPDPLPELVHSAQILERAGAQVLIMGCNTAHYYYPQICRHITTPFLHMLEESARAAYESGVRSVGMLATDGTVRSGVYAQALARWGVTQVLPATSGQAALMEMIYQGVKAGRDNWPVGPIMDLISNLADRGAQALLLGCTELPVAFARYHIDSPIPLLDPTWILAKSAVRFSCGETASPEV